MAKYGNSWWGKKWLDSLTEIDYTNRLPRGRTYANKGLVKDIIIDENVISSKVQGSQRQPYKQQVSVEEFTKVEKEKIISIITENPFILSKLINKELPIVLFEEMQNLHLKLFPTSWQDVKADCSCPDWAVPCKHIASVIYIIANEIDKNPFVVFSLHGLDILSQIEKLGFSSKGDFKLPIPHLSDGWSSKPIASNYKFNQSIISSIDYSLIEENNERILKLLDESPVFYPYKNFKVIVDKVYKKVKRNILKLEKETIKDEFVVKENLKNIIINIDDGLHFSSVEFMLDNEKLMLSGRFAMLTFIEQLKQVPVGRLLNYPASFIGVYLAYQFSIHLLKTGSYFPEILQIEDNRYIIRWIPALLIDEVKQVFEITAKILPPNNLVNHNSESITYFNNEEQLTVLCSVFLSEFIQNCEAWESEDIDNVFKGKEILYSGSYEHKETPQVIRKWLQKFNLTNKPFVPVIKIEENENWEGFDLSIWIEEKGQALNDLISLEKLFSLKKYAEIRLGILQDMAILADYLPQVQDVIRKKGKENIFLESERFVKVLLETIPALQLLGIGVLLPKSLQKLARPQLSMNIQTANGSSGKEKGYINLANMLSFDWEVAIGDQKISGQEFLKIVKKLKGIVKINDQYVLINEKEISILLKQLEKPPKVSEAELLKSALSGEYKDAKISLDAKAKDLINSLVKQEKVSLPQGLNATLRPYQLRGFEWMYKNLNLGFGCLLADDMGLGKTIQVITLILKLKEEGKLENEKVLIVVPTTLLTNWQKEIQRFAPKLETSIYHGAGRTLEVDFSDVIITTYGLVRSDIKQLQKIKWAMLGIDEAQNIKNTNTEQTKAVKKIKSERIVAMSGTPVENRLVEYWSIFDFTNKSYLGPLKQFQDTYIKPIELDRDQEKLDSFRKITAPFILRRVKTDKSIISDLPDKIEMDESCILSKEQTALYQNVVSMNLKEIEGEDGIARRGLVFKLMTALKQICNHPSNYLKKENYEPAFSGKADMLMTILENTYANNEKTLIFTQYKEMGDLLVQMIKDKFGSTPLFLHGGVTRKKRDEMVDVFQNEHQVKTMILSLKAGGTGLNLTKANNVIHYDLWWNPAVEAQATDRAYRIGQKKNVMVHRFITKGTFEEKINEMIKSKKELAELTVGTGENWISEMSDNELKEIFSLV